MGPIEPREPREPRLQTGQSDAGHKMVEGPGPWALEHGDFQKLEKTRKWILP